MVAEVTDIKGVGPAKAETLAENGYESVEDIVEADPDILANVDGVGDDRALEFIVEAENLVEAEEEFEEEAEDSFVLTPEEVSEELDESDEDDTDISNEEIEEIVEEEIEEDDEDQEESYDLDLSFASQKEYDAFHAALMRHHERVYTSNQPASDVMYDALEQLYGNSQSVEFDLTEYGLNTLHTAIKQARTNYQGDNLIDHMEALEPIEEQIDETRREELF